MKKIISLFIVFGSVFSSFAQEHSNTDDINPNITPFHDATESIDGVSYSFLLQQDAWKQFLQKHPSWGARFNRYTQLPHRAFGTPIAFAGGGNNAVAKAKLFLQSELGGFKIPINELVVSRNKNDGKYIHVEFKQVHAGKEILWSRVIVRFTQDLKIALFSVDAHRNINTLNASISSQEAIVLAEKAIKSPIENSTVENNLKLFPLPFNGIYEFHPVYCVTVTTKDDATTPGIYLTYVDATDGKILYRQNKVQHIGFNVTGDILPLNTFSTAINMPLKNIKVVVGATTYYSDATGLVNVTNTSAVNPTISLAGLFVKVVTGQNGNTNAVYSPIGVNSGDILTYPTNITNSSLRHVNVYYHTNEIHDYMKTKFPAFTAMDNPLTARVNRTDGTCNAFYNGSSINFYEDSSGCNALSEVGDVVYHEYGHGINSDFWNDNGGSFDNGGMGEGYADVWALCLIKNPIIGAGFYINQPNSFIRQYNNTPKVYPTDIKGQVHADGEIIAGAWWDVAKNLELNMPLSNAVDTMSDIFANSQYGLATGPDGTEGQVYYDILIDALVYDDNDNDITNGTPHFIEIVKAFATHGIYLLSTTELTNNTTSFHNPNISIPINTDVIADFPALLGDVKMVYREKGTSVLSTILLSKTGTNYTASFPAAVEGAIYEYYYTFSDIISASYSGTSPTNANFDVVTLQRNIPNYLLVGFNKLIYNQDFESPLSTNFIMGNVASDNATAGKWEVINPISSAIGGVTVQTGKDHTSGIGKCAVTDNANSTFTSATANDVDGGRTSFITEEMDLTGLTKPVISFWRWYSNSQGLEPRKDKWRVWFSYNNNGAGWSSWYNLERTVQPDVSWRQQIYLPNLTYGNKWRLMFTATDTSLSTFFNTNALIEAAVDDIQVYDMGSFPAGITDLGNLYLSIYPNPANNEITITSNEVGDAQLTILNTVGQAVYNSKSYFKNKQTIDCTQLANGIYFLKVEINQKTSVKRMVIRK
jgi:hypothetical protein